MLASTVDPGTPISIFTTFSSLMKFWPTAAPSYGPPTPTWRGLAALTVEPTTAPVEDRTGECALRETLEDFAGNRLPSHEIPTGNANDPNLYKQ